jgi:pimeloyl-ACP methyl ester carboxylesterase
MKTNNFFLGLVILLLAFLSLGSKNCFAQVMDSIKYENGFLYYHNYGSKNLPPVILLTGGPGNSYIQLDALARTLSNKFRCILPEQRGTGKSIPSPFDSTTISVNLLTLDIKRIMDILNLKEAIFIGHSWGGMLAMNFATQFPKNVKHLVLIAPGPHKEVKRGFDVLLANRAHSRSFDEEQRLKKLNDLIDKKEADSLEIMEASRLFRRAYIFANPIPDSLFALVNVDKNNKMSDIIMNEIFKKFDLTKSLNNYRGKVDIITGRQDIVGYCSHELKQDRPDANLYWINKCGHFPMYEQANEFYKILYDILGVKQVEKRPIE